MIVSPRAKPVIDIVRIEHQERIIEIDEVFLYRRKGESYEKVLYWKRGIHTAGGFGDKADSFYEWGDEIGEWGTELKNGEWGNPIPK